MFGFEFIQVLHRVIDDKFPPVNQTICYGSKVFQQKQQPSIKHNDTDKPVSNSCNSIINKLNIFKDFNERLNKSMIDCIFIVPDARKWHADNLLKNPSHYSLLMRYCGANIINKLSSYGSGILYNPFIDINWCDYNKLNNDLQMKYGVISTSSLISDLLHWNSCYSAGRLHKPTMLINDSINISSTTLMNKYHNNKNNQETLKQKLMEIYDNSLETETLSNININDAMLINWDYAMRVSLLLLIIGTDGIIEMNNIFTMDDILNKIVSLSYLGDDRMKFAENQYKIENIVNGSKDDLIHIYEPILEQYAVQINDKQYKCVVDVQYLLKQLPSNLIKEIIKYDRSLYSVGQNKWRYTEWLGIAIETSITNIIKKSSRQQLIKSIVSTDPTKLMLYLCQKLCKKSQN